MKAAFVKAYGVSNKAFEIREVNDPVSESDEVLIEVQTFGINYADVMARKGLYNDAPDLPFVPGYEVVGKVIQKGEQISDKIDLGDRVLAFTRFNGYASKVKVKEQAIVKLPEMIPNEEAVALATQYCTAWFAGVLRANMMRGETVLVHAGAGGVGTGLIQLAKHTGCNVIATAGSDKKIDYLKSIGVTQAVNYREQDFVSTLIQKGFKAKIDVIFDPIGGKSFRKNLKLLSNGGRMVMYGVSTWSHKRGTLLDKVKLALDFGILHPIELLMRSQSIIGVNMLRIADDHPQIIEQGLSKMVSLYIEGKIKPTVGGAFRIDELNKAHDLIESRKTIGKISVNWF